MPSTPTLFHAGTHAPAAVARCYLTTVEDDLAHIFKALGDNAQLSKWSGGLGNDWTTIRGTGAHIKSTNGESQGVIPFLKLANDHRRRQPERQAPRRHLRLPRDLALRHRGLPRAAQEHRRRAPPHARHEHGQLDSRPVHEARVERRRRGRSSRPTRCRTCTTSTAAPSRRATCEYEAHGRRAARSMFRKRARARLWRRCSRCSSRPAIRGSPSRTRATSARRRTTPASSTARTSAPRSRSTPPPTKPRSATSARSTWRATSTDGALDHERLSDTITTAIRMLDNVIDINFYPTERRSTPTCATARSGSASWACRTRSTSSTCAFDAPRRVEFTTSCMELDRLLRHPGLVASWPPSAAPTRRYKGSKWDRGLLPVDTLDLLETERGTPIDVDRARAAGLGAGAREASTQHGMRNSNIMAIAPTATIANIAGCFPCIEPIYKNIYVKSNLSGDFTVVNRYLVERPQGARPVERGHARPAQVLRRQRPDASTRSREACGASTRKSSRSTRSDRRRTPPRRGKWIDQSQSLNIFMTRRLGQADLATSTSRRGRWASRPPTTCARWRRRQIEKSTLDAEVRLHPEVQRRARRACAGRDDGARQPRSQERAARIERSRRCEACQYRRRCESSRITEHRNQERPAEKTSI